MGGWFCVTIEPNDKEGRRKELLKDLLYLQHKEGYELLDEQSVGRHGTMSHTENEQIREVMNEGEKVLIITANNTTDSGYGELKKMKNGELVDIDEMEGAERARGYDVVGYFSENHDIEGYARVEV